MSQQAERVQQISIFLQNRPGVVSDLCQALTEERINIRALTVLDTIDVGTLRLVVDDPDRAMEAFKKKGAAYLPVEVVAIPIKNNPGAFAEVAKTMALGGVNIEYVYASAYSGTERSLGIFRVDDVERALTLEFP